MASQVSGSLYKEILPSLHLIYCKIAHKEPLKSRSDKLPL